MVIRNKSLVKIPAKSPLILIDGTCIVCNRFAQFVIKKDKRKRFYFSSIHSAIGKTIIEELNLNAIDSIVFIHQNQIFIYSSAVVHVFKLLGSPWSLLSYCLNIFPIRLRDQVYKTCAKKRFLFGRKRDQCFIPSPHLNDQILK